MLKNCSDKHMLKRFSTAYRQWYCDKAHSSHAIPAEWQAIKFCKRFVKLLYADAVLHLRVNFDRAVLAQSPTSVRRRRRKVGSQVEGDSRRVVPADHKKQKVDLTMSVDAYEDDKDNGEKAFAQLHSRTRRTTTMKMKSPLHQNVRAITLMGVPYSQLRDQLIEEKNQLVVENKRLLEENMRLSEEKHQLIVEKDRLTETNDDLATDNIQIMKDNYVLHDDISRSNIIIDVQIRIKYCSIKLVPVATVVSLFHSLSPRVPFHQNLTLICTI
ncbi:hypothetical protein R1sor_021205 [Riccia sorocarpa]|uniref:Transposase n=1 Tax=Riccia sorocarpa TaxID=122646 RepID=A0ABD3GKL6_9MARC